MLPNPVDITIAATRIIATDIALRYAFIAMNYQEIRSKLNI
jgi:hypothetical protein